MKENFQFAVLFRLKLLLSEDQIAEKNKNILNQRFST
jgi:hypothetical protein